jgi:hypothetical protein
VSGLDVNAARAQSTATLGKHTHTCRANEKGDDDCQHMRVSFTFAHAYLLL